ncbi:MAG TPA: hypothetical protein VHL58_11775 [Thermoanaerobaculia bacterium]|nr:hypothetical protein [Thermoanaerobaculia bacterium]
MSNAADNSSNFPTMIIPKGTEIKINTQGQLSIKTPGNLVIQNSGTYSELESTNGSIRIEDNVNVEAVSVKAAQACFIQGTLTAWKVHAKRISLEDRAKAYIMLQESEQLDLSKTSRLVGNFSNEKEIYLMLAKFTAQLKELPGNVDMSASVGNDTHPNAFRPTTTQTVPKMTIEAPGPRFEDHEIPEALRQALTLLEREVRRPELDAGSLEAIREVVFGLRERNTARVGAIYRDAFTAITIPSDGFRQAFELIDGYFRRA